MAPERSLVGEGLKPLDPEEISHKLLLAGLEIEKVSTIDIYKSSNYFHIYGSQ